MIVDIVVQISLLPLGRGMSTEGKRLCTVVWVQERYGRESVQCVANASSASRIISISTKTLELTLFEWKKTDYLVVDYYSRFIEIAKVTSTTAGSVISHLKSIFACHRILEVVVSDNGPQYSSAASRISRKSTNLITWLAVPSILKPMGRLREWWKQRNSWRIHTWLC